MRQDEVIKTTPIDVEMSVRGDEIRALTSCKAGQIVPLAYFPILREDRVSRGSLRIAIDMTETVQSLMNAINVTAQVHFVPFLAFPHFNGSMETLNRSYQGAGEPHNGTPVPFFQQYPFKRNAPFWKTLGVHWVENAPINGAPLLAYNEIVNFRRKSRSSELPLYTGSNIGPLAQAFWKNPAMAHIVPHWDQAAMDGEVLLNIVSQQMPVKGLGFGQPPAGPGGTKATNKPVDETGGSAVYAVAQPVNAANLWFEVNGASPSLYAEMEENGITLSLANIELAKQTAAFARLREKYSALDKDHIIDLLMEGVRVPDEALKQPILLDRKSTIFGYSERHAMDGASLDMSVTTGSTSLDLVFRTPPMNTGGIIMVTLEIVPEQLHERIFDTFLGTTDPDQLPNFMRDYLDPEKVDVVPNKYVDVFHATPEGTFGYAPLNHDWKRSFARIGGKYYRPNPDTFVEDRQKFWSMEQLNPALTTDFYLVPPNLPHSVFLDTISDPFEVLTVGSLNIVGRTVFGKMLEEDEGHYDAIMRQVDTTRIDQEE